MGDILIAGKSKELSMDVLGLGVFDGKDLQSQTASVAITRSKDVKVWADDTLDISIPRSGTVTYYDAATVTESITGSGDIVDQGD